MVSWPCRPGLCRAALTCALLLFVVTSCNCQHLQAQLLRRAARTPAPQDSQSPWQRGSDRGSFSRSRLALELLSSGEEQPPGVLFSKAAAAPVESFVTLPPFPIPGAASSPVPSTTSKSQATAEDCDIFTQPSQIICNNNLFSDLPEFACCASINNGALCNSTDTGQGNVCKAPQLPSCCFAQSQPASVCTQRNSASNCGGNFPISACCSDTQCKVDQYAATQHCDKGSSNPNPGCCPA